MHNYSHEIPMPQSKEIEQFLWSDYFHDSIITSLCVHTNSKAKSSVTIKLQCDRDCEQVYQKLSAKKQEVWNYREELWKEKYTYNLTFDRVMYFANDNCSLGQWSEDYLNGRFKVSAQLQFLQQKSKKPLYHFRIQTTGGYIDVIFRKFSIKKEVGRIRYDVDGDDWNKIRLSTEEQAKLLEELWQIINTMSNDDLEQDYDGYRLLEKLYRSGAKDLLAVLREIVNSNIVIDDLKPYAAYLLGKFGDKSDLPKLRELYFLGEDHMQKLHILDSIEMLEDLNEQE